MFMDIEHWIFVLQLQRVLANLAIDKEVGHQAASNTECMELLTKVVGEVVHVCTDMRMYFTSVCILHTYVRTYIRMCTYVS